MDNAPVGHTDVQVPQWEHLFRMRFISWDALCT
jgi:hypothetical protein